jgi:hypothetical protein
MHALDPRTVEQIAKIIVDQGGDQERPGWQLERLLRHAGWADPPEYDGSPRVGWLCDALLERADPATDAARLLRRACDPLEYDGSRAVAECFRDHLNKTIEPEGLAITLVGGRPVVGEIGMGVGATPVFGVPENLEARLAGLIGDPAMVRLLVDRAEQSRMADAAGAHLLALVGIGSLVEGMLLAVLLQRDPALVLRNKAGKPMSFDYVGLAQLLDEAHARGHIELDAKEFMTPVRNFRNYIHPRKQATEPFTADRETVSLSWGPVHAVLNDLEQSALATGTSGNR